MLFDFLVVRQVTPSNPAHAVRGPKKDSLSGLRDRILIAAMLYSFARVSAAPEHGWNQFARNRGSGRHEEALCGIVRVDCRKSHYRSYLLRWNVFDQWASSSKDL
jgi:hypothetical protein